MTAYNIAQRYEGMRESNDPESLLNKFLAGDTAGMTSAQFAWCSRFMKRAVQASGGDASKATDAARSWLSVGDTTTDPKPGDIAVFSRGDPGSWKGHVGFYDRTNDDGSIRVFGGNQSDAVGYGNYPADRLLGYRSLSAPTDTSNNVQTAGVSGPIHTPTPSAPSGAFQAGGIGTPSGPSPTPAPTTTADIGGGLGTTGGGAFGDFDAKKFGKDVLSGFGEDAEKKEAQDERDFAAMEKGLNDAQSANSKALTQLDQEQAKTLEILRKRRGQTLGAGSLGMTA